MSRPLVIPAAARHSATVIFAHGLGDTGLGWAPGVEEWRSRQRLNHVKFILPHARTIPITVNMGMSMPGWYDIKTLGSEAELRRNEDREGILYSQAYFHELIQSEIASGIPADRILLGGFSQGGAMSLFAGLTAPVRLAGIVGLSSYLLLHGTFRNELPQPQLNEATPIFMAHGRQDPVVPFAAGTKSRDLLKEMGYAVAWHEYNMQHSTCPQEMIDVEDFLLKALPEQPATESRSEL